MMSLLPSLLILGTALLLSVFLSYRGAFPAADSPNSSRLRHALFIATLLQSGHFAEEAITGFHIQFPALFGLQAMPFMLFMAFNLLWIGLWLAAIIGIKNQMRIALVPAWFLAIAGSLNGVAHPAMALLVEGYFPGLYSAPIVGFACVWLWVRLMRATRYASHSSTS